MAVCLASSLKKAVKGVGACEGCEGCRRCEILGAHRFTHTHVLGLDRCQVQVKVGTVVSASHTCPLLIVFWFKSASGYHKMTMPYMHLHTQ